MSKRSVQDKEDEANKRVKLIIDEIKESKNEFDYSILSNKEINDWIFFETKRMIWKELTKYNTQEDDIQEDNNICFDKFIFFNLLIYFNEQYIEDLQDDSVIKYSNNTKDIFIELFKGNIIPCTLYQFFNKLIVGQIERLERFYGIKRFQNRFKLLDLYTQFLDRDCNFVTGISQVKDKYIVINDHIDTSTHNFSIKMRIFSYLDSAYLTYFDELYYCVWIIQQYIKKTFQGKFSKFLVKLILTNVISNNKQYQKYFAIY